MSITRTTLTGPVVLPDGTRPANGTIHFTLSAWDREPGEGLVIPGPTSVQIGSDGDFSVELFRTSSGENSVNYEVAVTHVPAPGEPLRTVIIGNIGLAGPGPFALPDLEIVPSWVPNSVDILAEVNAAAIAVDADRLATETARVNAETAATNAGNSATQAEQALASTQEILSYSQANPFVDYDAAIAADIPAPVTSISIVGGSGARVDYVEDAAAVSPALTTNDGRKWVPLGVKKLSHYGVDFSERSAANDARIDTAISAALADDEVLDWEGVQVTRHTAATYSATGHYQWKNVDFYMPDATGDTEAILFLGPDHDAPIEMTADVAVGDLTCEIASGQLLAAGDRVILISTAIYNTDAGSNAANKSEYITIADYTGTTVTFETPLQSSYLVADAASVVKTNTRDLKVEISGKFRGGGVGYGQTLIRATRCSIGNCYLDVQNFESRGFWREQCSQFTGYVTVTGGYASNTSLGYLAPSTGCDVAVYGVLFGQQVRHVFTGNRSSGSITIDGQSCTIMGGDIVIAGIIGPDNYAAPFDTHASVRNVVCGNVSGNLIDGETESGLVVQSANVQLGNVNVTGSDQQGVLVQCFGKPSDEPPAQVTMGDVYVGVHGSTAGACIAVYNERVTDPAPVHVNIKSLNGVSRYGIFAQIPSGGGNLHVSINGGSIEADDYHAVFARTYSAVGQVFVNCGADVVASSASTSHYLGYALGQTYATANGGVNGAFIRFNGKLERVGAGTIAFRQVDGKISLASNVLVEAPTFSIGDVYRDSEAVVT